MTLNKEKNQMLIDFITYFGKLPPAQVVGVAKILGVNVLIPIKEEGELPQPRELTDILSDIIDAFVALPRSQRKNLLSIIKKASKV